MENIYITRLAALRKLMNEKGVDYYMIPTADFHNSEYVHDYFKCREFMSGFTGSNGTMVIGQEAACLWTDGRYFIQAERELAGSGIVLMRMNEPGVPKIADYLKEKMKAGETLGFDGRCVSASQLISFKETLKDVTYKMDEALGGDVEVQTELGEGTTFTVRLPLTLAIIQALMVKVGEEQYAISLGSIQTVEDVEPNEVKHVQGKEVMNLRGTVIPLFRLSDILDVPDVKNDGSNLTVVVIKKGDKQAGLVVDSLIGQMEIVIKSLGKYIHLNKMISGATILGNGDVALIIDANAIL